MSLGSRDFKMGKILFILLIATIAEAGMPFAFWRATSSGPPADPCSGKSIGQSGAETTAICAGTYSYGGAIGTKTLMVTPGNCNDSVTPTCGGTTDTITKLWATGFAGPYAMDADDGLANSIMLSAQAQIVAAKWCRSLTYGGYSDWYLPAKNELNNLYGKKASIAGFNTSGSFYWSSTDFGDASDSWAQRFSDGLQVADGKNATYILARCIRRY